MVDFTDKTGNICAMADACALNDTIRAIKHLLGFTFMLHGLSLQRIQETFSDFNRLITISVYASIAGSRPILIYLLAIFNFSIT